MPNLAYRLCLPLCLGVSLGLTGCKGAAKDVKASAAPGLTVSVQAAELRQLDESLALTGAIAPWQSLVVSPEANGLQVTAVLTDEGQHVRRGQALVKLDDRTIRAQLENANAQLLTAQAQLGKAQTPSRPQDLSTARASVSQAEASLRDAQANFNAYKDLAAEGAVTRTDLSAKSSALVAAQAGLQSARDRLTLASIPARTEDLNIARAAVQQASATRDQLEVQLSQTVVTAPADGLILTKNVLIGDVASVGKSMFTLARDGRLEMDANLSEGDLPKVHPLQLAEVRSNALPGLVAAGHVREISPSLNGTSRQATVKIDLPAGTTFHVGMFASATLRLGQHKMLAVPTDAIVNRGGRNQVFVVSSGVVHAHDISAGDGADGWTSILGGVEPGESVVTAGVGFLKEGDPVAVTAALPVESLGNLDSGTNGATAAAAATGGAKR